MAAPETPVCRLTYFDAPGRAELARLCLHAGGTKFEDKRLSFKDWGELKDKSNFPFGSMPILENGKFKVAQSQACSLYACELSIGSYTPLQRATMMMYAGVHADVQSAMYKCLFGSEESKKGGLAVLPAAVKKLFGGVEKLLPVAGGYVLGGPKPSLADLAIFDNVTSNFPGLKALGQDLSAFPKILALVAKVQADDCLKSYLATRGF